MTTPDDRPRKAILLFGHGSRAAEYPRPFERIRAAIESQRPGTPVALGFLELTRPSLEEGIDTLVARGARQIMIVPIFIGPGRHVLKDLPELCAAALMRHPGLAIELAPPIGESQAVIDAMAQSAVQALAAAGPGTT